MEDFRNMNFFVQKGEFWPKIVANAAFYDKDSFVVSACPIFTLFDLNSKQQQQQQQQQRQQQQQSSYFTQLKIQCKRLGLP